MSVGLEMGQFHEAKPGIKSLQSYAKHLQAIDHQVPRPLRTEAAYLTAEV